MKHLISIIHDSIMIGFVLTVITGCFYAACVTVAEVVASR